VRIQDKRHLALVLSGGGIKAAAFHIGVCIALKEKGFRFAGGTPDHVRNIYADDAMTFKTYVGSSAGAVISTFLAAGYDIDSVVEAFLKGSGQDLVGIRHRREKAPQPGYLKPFSYRDLFALNVTGANPSKLFTSFFKRKPVLSGGLEVLLKQGFRVNGVFSTKNLEKYLREHCHPENTFQSLGVKLYVVATQLNYSRKVVFGDFAEENKDEHLTLANHAKVSEAVAASTALPPFFAPYPITDTRGREIFYFDGEIRDTLSTHVAADHGADLVISSYSIQPYHFNKEIGSLHNYGMPVIFNQALYQVVQQKILNHIRNQKNTRQMINAVDGYLKEINVPDEHREKLLEILKKRTNFRPEVDYIYIHPSPMDHEFFFADHFSLNPDILAKIVRAGFRAAMQAMRKV
jgi:predicted acylesterase/phospholipase RssA